MNTLAWSIGHTLIALVIIAAVSGALLGLVLLVANWFHGQIIKRTYLGQVMGLIRFFALQKSRGGVTRETKEKLLEWLESNPKNRKIFIEVYRKRLKTID